MHTEPTKPELLSDEAASIYVERLEALWHNQLTRATEGDTRAADVCLSLLDRFARFYGLRN